MDTLWEDGSPNGQEAENCAKTNMDRKWKDAPCDERNCALCHFPSGMNITMRGLCGSETKIMEGFFDVSYFLKGFINLKPHWRGYGKSHIYFRPRRQVWRLESFYDPVSHRQRQSIAIKRKYLSVTFLRPDYRLKELNSLQMTRIRTTTGRLGGPSGRSMRGSAS